jgi:hypothetical protein
MKDIAAAAILSVRLLLRNGYCRSKPASCGFRKALGKQCNAASRSDPCIMTRRLNKATLAQARKPMPIINLPSLSHTLKSGQIAHLEMAGGPSSNIYGYFHAHRCHYFLRRYINRRVA